MPFSICPQKYNLSNNKKVWRQKSCQTCCTKKPILRKTTEFMWYYFKRARSKCKSKGVTVGGQPLTGCGNAGIPAIPVPPSASLYPRTLEKHFSHLSPLTSHPWKTSTNTQQPTPILTRRMQYLRIFLQKSWISQKRRGLYNSLIINIVVVF